VVNAELDAWLSSLDYLLDHLRDRYVPADFPLDYSSRSLVALERLVLARYPEPATPHSTEDSGGFVQSAMAYLGEVLLRTGGGRWTFDAAPLVAPDGALELSPISPLQLITDAVGVRTGTVFTDAYDELREAVEDLQEQDPSWAPTKAFSVIDDIEVKELPAAFRAWLAEREASFDRWVADAGRARGELDFSPDSLDALHALVRRNLPGGRADIDRPERRPFVDGAVWYFGEVVRRATGAAWQYHEGDADNPLANVPIVQTFGPDGNMSMPIGAIELAADSEDPSPLHHALSLFD
jgi:hypothetical protein